ncbi:MAG: AMP-binding protein, partial [Gammaproteobacteria bacterium]|nr:AMP-binding protein [Gammaproteobacteria bacterium]
MNLQRLLKKLCDRRVEIWVEEEKLRYRAPRESMTEDLLTELKANRQDLIKHFQVEQQQPFPLTYGQRALWFLHQRAPKSSTYNLAFSARILSPVDEKVLEQTFTYLARRHQSIRLRFQTNNGEPYQFISSDNTIDFQVVNGNHRDQAALTQQVNQSYNTPFDLNNQLPLFRVRLFKLSTQQSVLLIVCHHIIFDGWSLWLMLDEFAKIYSSLKSSEKPDLPRISATFRQFTEQQLKRVNSGQLEQDWEYWQHKFKKIPPQLNLPTRRAFPEQRSYQGGSIPIRINDNILKSIKSMATECGATLYIVLLSAFQLLLHRCSGQQQLCIGTPMSGREDDRYSGVIGYFVNPLPLLSEMHSSLTVKEFIQACREEVLSAMAHQEFPLALVIERLSQSRDSSRPPLFQAAFSFQQLQKAQQLLDLNSSHDASDKTADWGGLQLAPFTLHQQEGQFDLSLELMQAGNELIGSLKYNTDVLDADDTQRLVDYYLNIVVGLNEYKDQRAVDVPLLNQQQHQQLIHTWNQTDYHHPPALIPELLSRQAHQTPDAVAVVSGDHQLSYRDLEQRSNQLAHYLHQHGAGREDLVAVCMERSLELVISLHAILKAGAA